MYDRRRKQDPKARSIILEIQVLGKLTERRHHSGSKPLA
jgi:hypothetical protein